jgi:hypothetical protein
LPVALKSKRGAKKPALPRGALFFEIAGLSTGGMTYGFSFDRGAGVLLAVYQRHRRRPFLRPDLPALQEPLGEVLRHWLFIPCGLIYRELSFLFWACS